MLRLASLLIFSLGLIGLSLEATGAWLVVLLLVLPTLNAALRSMLLQRILRLKWFFMAISVLYLFGQPGGGVLAGDWSGLLPAAHRVSVLMLMVAAVSLSLQGLSAPELAQACTRLFSPLAVLGLDTAAFGRRLALSLDAVSRIDEMLKKLRQQTHKGREAWLAATAQLFVAVEQHEFQAPAEQCTQLPRVRDYGLLLALSMAVALAQVMSR